MLSYDDALLQVLAHPHPLIPHLVPIRDALNRVLAGDVFAPMPVPPFANSQMDGYAFRSEDWAKGQRVFPVQGTAAAGDASMSALHPGHVFRIMTGAPMPLEADTVIPIEDTDGGSESVIIRDAGTAGQYIRHAGEDIGAGHLAVGSGTLLRPSHVGLLAALGLDRISVHRTPRVALLSTGDELTPPGETLAPGHIFNSNYYALAAQVQEAGGIVSTPPEHSLVRDIPEDLRTAFHEARTADVIVSSGGVSVGAFDHVKAVWEEHGTLEFWRVAIRPGKPFAFGRGENGTLFFGLPGNPISAMVTFELFVRPVLLKMRGLIEISRPAHSARLSAPASHEPGRRSFQRGVARLDGEGWNVAPFSGQGSHLLRTAAQSNALLILSEDRAHWDAGEILPIVLWN